MNIAQAFADYLEEIGFGILGVDLFISRVPSGTNAPGDAKWIVGRGGFQVYRTVTGEEGRQASLSLYMRSYDAQLVYDSLEALDARISCSGCLELEGYNVIEVETSGPFADQDLDDEERTVGLLEITVTLYRNCYGDS